ncbi:polysaccharide chain length determinant protein (PEP-CTERM system associated) [Anaerospora hongkongensis]|uniref:Polysaccharide chain length determinant protein (PEP-CTERM system associated) n=1 Tax=Anaerospora hongkongensis TaxID=244830 RepID=A0A4R1PXT3_9FIRM|nr:GumC family protein [Anaerospora hongkongensis]TCL36062.1 polysaccharide chain length determinant protein (PEP-CTERM system associated) [Anaerospora hongkongensis]
MDEQTLDLRDMIKTIKKRRRIIGSIFFGFIAIATIISLLIPPTYEAETTLRVKQTKGLANSLLSELPMGGGNTKQLMSTYAEIIKSRTVIQEVIEKTQLGKDKVPDYDDMLKLISTQPVKDTEILKIQVRAKSREEAQNVANVLVDTFNNRMTFLVRSEQKVVREFIGQRLQESKQELDRAETILQKYKNEQKIVAPAEETKAMVDKLTTISKLAAENYVTLASAQARFGSAEQQLSKEKPGFIADSLVIQQYKTKLADLEVQLVSLSQKYTDKHPEVLATRAAIGEARTKLNIEISRVVSADAPSANPIHQGLLKSKIESEAEIAASTAQKQAIDKVITDSEKELAKLPTKEQGLGRVMRDAAVAQEIFIMLSKRHEEARISEVMQPTDVQVIDAANLPEKPISPKKLLNVVIAAILGLFVGTGAAFVLEYMNKTVRTAEDVRQYLDLPVLGSIPNFDSEFQETKQSLWSRITQSATGTRRG